MKLRQSHLPTWLLIIGYPVFWGEMLLHPGSHTTFLAPVLFIGFTFWQLSKDFHRNHTDFHLLTGLNAIQCSWVILGGTLLLIGGFAALLPPHLGQELDALNYHLSLPRQHLVLGTFAHLSWSTADLWLLPIQFALSPYWFCTTLPNKIPQYIFLLGLLLIARDIGKRTGLLSQGQWALLAALVGSHGLAIQFGTAMIDLVIVYLALATLDSVLNGDWAFAAIESSFFVWSKSFMPLQIGLILAGLGILVIAGHFVGFQWTMTFTKPLSKIQDWSWKSFGRAWVIGSLLIGGPFVLKSLYYAGTPLFPFRPFALEGRLGANPSTKEAVINAAAAQRGTRDAYGRGRSLSSLITHIWYVAVPEKGVNNDYDYPLGLPFLLVVGPFIFLFARSLRRHEVPVLAGLVILFWGTWWIGSQQSRWLYIPLALMLITTFGVDWIAENRYLTGALSVALLLTTLSVLRAHLPDLRDPSQAVRYADRQLLEQSRQWSGPGPMPWESKEIAFAECPIEVQSGSSYWILNKR